MHPGLKFVLDLGPLVVFFAGFFLGDMFVATGAFMVATVVALIISYALERKVAMMPLITGVVVLVFGGLTLYLHDERFIKMKPTIVYTLFATTLFGGLMTGRLFIKLLFGTALQLTDEGWRKFTVRWGLFFLFAAALNEYVWRSYSEEFWITFKVWGFMSLTMVFAITQTLMIQKYIIKPNEAAE